MARRGDGGGTGMRGDNFLCSFLFVLLKGGKGRQRRRRESRHRRWKGAVAGSGAKMNAVVLS